MSLTSYRAAPSRATNFKARNQNGGVSLRKADRPMRQKAPILARLIGAVIVAEATKPDKIIMNGFFRAAIKAPAAMPGDALLFQRLSGSTIGAIRFHGRVRDGIGWVTDAMVTKQ
jgi:hypothetical protein